MNHDASSITKALRIDAARHAVSIAILLADEAEASTAVITRLLEAKRELDAAYLMGSDGPARSDTFGRRRLATVCNDKGE